MGRRAEFEERRDLTRLLVGRAGRLEARADEAASRLQRLVASGGADPAIDYWLAEGVLALAVHRARSVGVEHPLWSEAEAEIRERSRQAAMLQDLALMQVTRALEREGIPSVVLKGAPMARRLYGEAELRSPSGDLDLLVPVERLNDASRVVVGLGWGEAGDESYADGLPDLHWAHPGAGGIPAVELHWRVQWYERGEHSRGILEGRAEHGGAPVAAPLDQLSILLLCFARDGFRRLRLGVDVAAWWDAFEDDAVDLHALWSGALGRPHAAAALAASAILATPPPPSDVLPPRSQRWLAAIAVADRPVDDRTGFTQVALVDVLAAPPDLRRHRLSVNWLRSPEFLAVRYPALAKVVGARALRYASLARTIARMPRLLWRTVRAAPPRG